MRKATVTGKEGELRDTQPRSSEVFRHLNGFQWALDNQIPSRTGPLNPALVGHGCSEPCPAVGGWAAEPGSHGLQLVARPSGQAGVSALAPLPFLCPSGLALPAGQRGHPGCPRGRGRSPLAAPSHGPAVGAGALRTQSCAPQVGGRCTERRRWSGRDGCARAGPVGKRKEKALAGVKTH